MAKYRKRPVVIEAVQFHTSEPWPPGVERYDPIANRGAAAPPFGEGAVPAIDTLEGWHRVSEGDWIITGVKGERYPCKPDIFAATYEEVVADDAT